MTTENVTTSTPSESANLSGKKLEWHLACNLEEVLTIVQYAHAIASLITEQRDFPSLPAHQQIVLGALSDFTHEAQITLSKLLAQHDAMRDAQGEER